MDAPCPANGLGRAMWFRDSAAEYSDAGNPGQAAYCLSVATSIEARLFAERPLCVMMEGAHVTPPTR